MKRLYESLMELGTYRSDGKQIFVIVKPGSLHLQQEIIDHMKEAGWNMSMSRSKKLLLSEAKSLYNIHKKEKWYEPLCKYMSSDISLGLIFTKPGITNKNDFKEVAEIKDKIREEFGESDMRNVMHSSDSMEHMKHEAAIYFGIF